MKNIIIFLLLLLIVVGGAVYYFRYDLFQYSAESIVRSKLPPYVAMEKIVFDLEKNVMRIENLGIKNPRGYDSRFLAEAGEIICRYKMRSKNILDGLEITDITATNPVINIERQAGGRVNVNEMDQVMSIAMNRTAVFTQEAHAEDTPEWQERIARKNIRNLKISDIIKLPETINIKNGKVIFTDKFIFPDKIYTLTFENINGQVSLKLSNDYSKVLFLSTRGRGNVNGNFSQRIDWHISYYPLEKDLTMTNRYEVSGVDVTLFRPYYDRYSPIFIDNGRCSGTLVFDFDHGQIGSMNILVLQGLRFREKQGRAGSSAWEGANITELIRYLSSGWDEITFDFKIKGDVNNPRFFPGPHVKQALQQMVVNKVSEAFTPKEGEAKSDAEKVMDALKGLF